MVIPARVETQKDSVIQLKLQKWSRERNIDSKESSVDPATDMICQHLLDLWTINVQTKFNYASSKGFEDISVPPPPRQQRG